MEFKGTKGKWDVMSHEYEHGVYVLNNANLPIDLMEDSANALLISKAPEMLEMLIELRDDCDGNNFSSFRDKLEYLIKQATDVR